MENHSIDVSVIVATRNEGVYLRHCLESVRKQTYPWNQVEIVVVDNQSTDRTLSIANRFTHKVYNKGPERSSQRNFGVKYSIGKYILYLDADMLFGPDVIKECVNKCESSQDIAVYIPKRFKGKYLWVKIKNFKQSFYDGSSIDSVRFVRRDKFLEVGGFDEELSGLEEWDFDRKINANGKTGRIDSPLYIDKSHPEVKKYAYTQTNYAKFFKKYREKWGKNDLIVRKQASLAYRSFGIFIENGKWKRLVIHPFWACGAFILRCLKRK